MTDKNLEALDQLQTYFDLQSEDILKIVSYISAGHNLIAAGVSIWNAPSDQVTRFKTQFRIPGMNIICDDTLLYQKLMVYLHSLQEELLETTKPEDIDRVMYLYTLDPVAEAFKLHFFTPGIRLPLANYTLTWSWLLLAGVASDKLATLGVIT